VHLSRLFPEPLRPHTFRAAYAFFLLTQKQSKSRKDPRRRQNHQTTGRALRKGPEKIPGRRIWKIHHGIRNVSSGINKAPLLQNKYLTGYAQKFFKI
jgi:hypothetical protein